MATWKLVNHIAENVHHQSLHRDTETGIMREVHTTCRNGYPTGPSRECYWHPSEPATVTHPWFEEAAEAIGVMDHD